MLAVVEHTLWATLSVFFGKNVDVMTELHGIVRMNAPLLAHTYVI